MLHNPWPETLSLLLARSDLSQARLAARMKISHHTVSRWMVRRSRPRDEQFDEIAKAFACSPTRLGQIYSRILASHYAGAADGRGRSAAPGGNPPEGAGPAGHPAALEARAEALMGVDLEPFPLPLRTLLRGHRKALRDLVARFLSDADQLISSCRELLEVLGQRRPPNR